MNRARAALLRPFHSLSGVAFGVGLSLASVGCGGQPPAVPDQPGKGEAATTADPSKYPVGPYGYSIGDVVPNLKFVGRADDNKNGNILDDPAREIQFADIYQDKSVKAFAMLVAAEWCGPCQEEQWDLQTTWTKYQADNAGVAYVEALIESATKDANGNFQPADLDTIKRWASRSWADPAGKGAPQKISFPMVVDPTVELGPYYATPAFPMQLLIRTSDMTIQWQNNGYDPAGLSYNIAQITNP